MHEMFLMFVLSSCNLIYCFGFQPFLFYPCCVSLDLLNIDVFWVVRNFIIELLLNFYTLVKFDFFR